MSKLGKKGATLIEVIIVVVITAVVVAVALPNLFGRKGKNDLVNTTLHVTTLLREAQQLSAAQSSSTAWGVRFENNTSTGGFYVLYHTAYATTTVRERAVLPTTVAYITSSIPFGGHREALFRQLSGLASSSLTIGFYLVRDASISSTIVIATSGAVTSSY